MIKFGDCLELMKTLDDNSVDLIVTSPPYKDIIDYNNEKQYNGDEEYLDWLVVRLNEMYRIIKPTGSIIFNINDKCENGFRNTYVFDLVSKVSKETKLKLYDRYIWQKPNTLPIQGKRLNDRMEFIFHWVKKKDFKANTNAILQPYSEKSLERMNPKYTFKTNQKIVDGIRQTTEAKTINPDEGGTKPCTLFNFKTAGAIKNKGEKHPAPYHPELPEFFIKWLTDEGDVVLDPFSGSFTTYKESVRQNRNAIGLEINKDYEIFSPYYEEPQKDDFWD